MIQAASAKPSTDVSSLLVALRECCRSRNLESGRSLHSFACENGLSTNIHVTTSLINMYANCGAMVEARKLFHDLHRPNVVAWNCLIWGYVDNGENELALELYDGMPLEPDGRTFVAALTACASLASRWRLERRECSKKWLEKGKEIHTRASKSHCCNVYVQSSLIHMYSKYEEMSLARKVFDHMTERNIVTWNALLYGYVENGESQVALKLFAFMEKNGCSPDSRTFVAALSACAALGGQGKDPKWLQKGREIHSQAVKLGWCDKFVWNTLVDMYAKCGSMSEARDVFDNMSQRCVVSWTALLQGYVDNNENELALRLFDEMRESGCTPRARTFVPALSACGNLSWLAKGRALHSQANKLKCCDSFVQSTLVGMYSKCRIMEEARKVFDDIVQPNVVSWTALIMGYAENGESELALEMVAVMDAGGTARTSLTYVAALTACGNLMALEPGMKFHADVQSCGLDKDVVVCNCLVDFYGKCGSMEQAKKVFDSIRHKTLISWNSLICGYSSQGDTPKVFEVFRSMREQGFGPNDVTFVCLLSACSHAGMTDQGRECFDSMQVKYGVTPNVKHYSCLVDLLGRGNYLEEALRVVTTMPVKPDVVTWTALLAACKRWSNVGFGSRVFDSFLKLNGRDSSAAFVLMADIYRSASRSCGNLHRNVSCTTWIDRSGNIHRFVEYHVQ